MKNPLLIAHRGGTGLWPENTLEAFRSAIDMGADGIELDVHLTRDGIAVVHHDERLNPAIARQPDGQWVDAAAPLIKELSSSEIADYDIGRLRPGSAYAERFPDQYPIDGARIPKLDEVFALVKASAKPGFRLYVEAKTSLLDLSLSSEPEQLAEAIIELVRGHGLESQTILVSFDWRALAHAKRIAPEIKNAFTTLPFADIDPGHESAARDEPGSERQLLRAASAHGAPWMAGYDWRHAKGESFAEKMLNAIGKAPADGWFAWHGDINAERIIQANSFNLRTSAWTVDKPADISRLLPLGLDAILTDRPDVLANSLLK